MLCLTTGCLRRSLRDRIDAYVRKVAVSIHASLDSVQGFAAAALHDINAALVSLPRPRKADDEDNARKLREAVNSARDLKFAALEKEAVNIDAILSEADTVVSEASSVVETSRKAGSGAGLADLVERLQALYDKVSRLSSTRTEE